MVTPELLAFIRTQHKEGISKEDLEELLVSEGGWNKEDIAEAYTSVLNNKNLPTENVLTVDVPPALVVDVANVIEPEPIVLTVEEPPLIEIKNEEILPIESVLPAPALVDEEIKTIEVQRPKIAVVEKNITTDNINEASASTMKGEDDFLGIFNEITTPTVAHESVPSMSPSSQMDPVSSLSPTLSTTKEKVPDSVVVNAPFPFTPPGSSTDVSPNPILSIDNILADATQNVPVSSAMFPTPVSPIETSSPIVTDIPASTAFKFDFSKIRTAGVPGISASVAGDQTEQIVNTIPTVSSEVKTVLTPLAPTTLQSLLIKDEKSNNTQDAPLQGVMAQSVTATPQNIEEKREIPKSSLGRRSMASDLLLRGMGTTITGMPAINPPPENALPEPIKKPEGKNPQQLTSEIALAEEIKKKNEVKRTLALAIGGGVLLVAILVAVFIFFKFNGQSALQTSGVAFSHFFDLTSFSYKGKGNVDLVLSTAIDGIPRTGIAKFDFDYNGLLKNSNDGYGDGLHHAKFSGELSSGNFAWKTDTPIESDIRVIGSILYFRVLSFPSTSNLDPELFRTYWIKVNLSEIAKELALSGVSLAKEGYGNFGEQSSETTFNALLKKNTPFSVATNLPDAELNGVTVYHIEMQTDPSKMLALTSALYQKYFSKELLLTPDQRIRFLDALTKIKSEAWIDKKTGALMQISFSANFDDDMVDVHVKGPVNLLFTFADFNKEVVTDTPTPILTLEELKVRMDDFKKITDARLRDQEKVDRMSVIIHALDSYKNAKGRFPVFLSELYSAGVLATSTIEETKLKAYAYAAYLNKTSQAKVNRCTVKGKICAYYHIGVNLEDTTNPLLQNDADATSDVRGNDDAGCAGESNFACYDLITPDASSLISDPTTTTSSPGQ